MEHPNIDIVLGAKPAGQPTEEERAEMREACANFNLKEHLGRLSAVASENAVRTAGPQVSPDVRMPLIPVEGGDFSKPEVQKEIAQILIGNSVLSVDPSDTPEEEKHAEG